MAIEIKVPDIGADEVEITEILVFFGQRFVCTREEIAKW